jgi:hypothetical protein
MFIGEVYSKGGRLFEGQPFEDRQEAARYVFRNARRDKLQHVGRLSRSRRQLAAEWHGYAVSPAGGVLPRN